MELSIISYRECIFAYTRPMEILGNFLTDDVGVTGVESMISWVKNSTYTVTTLNYSFVKKVDTNICVYFLYDGYGVEDHPNRVKFETTIEDFIGILTQWPKVSTTYNKLVYIEKKGGKTLLYIKE